MKLFFFEEQFWKKHETFLGHHLFYFTLGFGKRTKIFEESIREFFLGMIFLFCVWI